MIIIGMVIVAMVVIMVSAIIADYKTKKAIINKIKQTKKEIKIK